MAPAVAGETVVIGSCSGTVYGLDAAEGQLRWSYDTSADGPAAQFHGEALVRKGNVIIGADGPAKAHLYAFDASTGELRWKRPFGHGVPTRILAFDASIAFVTGDGILTSVDPSDGRVRWTFEPEGRIEGRQRVSAVSNGDAVLFHAPDGELHLFDAASGKKRMQVAIGSPPAADPAFIGRDFVAATESGVITRIDGRSGRIVAQRKLSGRMYGSLQSDGNRVFALVLRAREAAVVALDSRLQIEWEQTASGEWSFRPLVRDGKLFIGRNDGLCSLDTADGAVECVPVSGAVRGIALDGGRSYVGTTGGVVYAVPVARRGEMTDKDSCRE
ncbi:MAG TPA: PQQ-binding-like beta-propeller repeat protein [Thermoanaerobaculia bacterium]|nr:PQQ-binding-like beta-propeller repeat protein [Thermoanaerobaculia bacterium]